MKMDVSCTFGFAAAHFLTKYHGRCENLHGHNYKIIVTATGEVGDDGMVVDFSLIKKITREKIVETLDHTNLNDKFDNPSAEHIAKWIWDELKNNFTLKKISVYETEDQWVEYDGN